MTVFIVDLSCYLSLIVDRESRASATGSQVNQGTVSPENGASRRFALNHRLTRDLVGIVDRSGPGLLSWQ